jgi:hypothetical protein
MYVNEFRFHLELSPVQLKIVHTALRSLADDFGHDQSAVRRVVFDVLQKLPDEHAIRAIELDAELKRERARAVPAEAVNGLAAGPSFAA